MSGVPWSDLIREAKEAGDTEAVRALQLRQQEARQAEEHRRRSDNWVKPGSLEATDRLLRELRGEPPGAEKDPTVPGNVPPAQPPAHEEKPKPPPERFDPEPEPIEPEPVEPAREAREAAAAWGVEIPEPKLPWEPGGDSHHELLYRRGGFHIGPDGRILSVIKSKKGQFGMVPEYLRVLVCHLAVKRVGTPLGLIMELCGQSNSERPFWALWASNEELADRLGTTRKSVSEGWATLREWTLYRDADQADHERLSYTYHSAGLERFPSSCRILEPMDRWTLPADLAEWLVGELNRRAERKKKRGRRRAG